MAVNSEQAEKLRKIIIQNTFITGKEEPFGFTDDPDAWIFDFRKILMNGEASDLITDIFYHTFIDEYPFQVCTLEIAGVPLATSIMNKLYARGHTDANAFFIRKSRKKTGLFRMIEGTIQEEKKIILVDDVINSGNSFWRQIEVLEELGYKPDTVWALLRYRDVEYYKRFARRGITVKSLFTLDDLTDELGEHITQTTAKNKKPIQMPFTAEWVFRSKNPTLGYVCSKSQPIIDEDKIYFGSDDKYFWAINQKDGSVAWKFKVAPVAKKKAIFSSPVLHKDAVIFGAYDGNLYCLDRHTGEKKWVSLEADWIGSSPAVAKDLNLIFIGLEYGLFKKMGGLMAIDATTGKLRWIDRTHQAMTHGSPLYIAEHQQVTIGSNDGVVRLHDAETGDIKWTFTTVGAADYDPVLWTGKIGFSNGDIKEGFAYDPERDYLMFGSIDGFFYILERATGHLVKYFKCDFGIFSTPYLHGSRVYFTSTDKRVRCVDLETLELVFTTTPDHTRIFSTPTIVNGSLYIGTNAGRLHELDPKTGERLAYFQANERITNTVVYNAKTDTYFLPTFANEIIALKREKNKQ